MKQEILKNFEYLPLTLFAMLLFMPVFCGAVAWVWYHHRGNTLEKFSTLPLEGGSTDE